MSKTSKKKVFAAVLPLALLLCLHSGQARSQWKVGVTSGAVFNSMETNTSYAYDFIYEPSVRFMAAAVAGYQFTDWLAVQAEPGFIQKGYRTKRNNVFVANNYSEVINDYVQLPLYARFSFGGRALRGYADVGGFVNYWTHSQARGNAGNSISDYFPYDQSVPFDDQRDNRIEAGLVGGLGVEYTFAKTYTVFVAGKYFYSLTDMQKQYMGNQQPRYNNTFTLQLGLMYSF